MLETSADTQRREQKELFRREFIAKRNEIFDHTIPVKFRGADLNDLQSSPKSRLSTTDQKALYEELEQNPLLGYAFFAPAGYSKTTCSYALFQRAIVENLFKWWPRQSEYWAWDYKPRRYEYAVPATEWEYRRPRIYVWRKSVPDLLQQHFTMFNYAGGENEPEPPQPDITVEKIEEAVGRGFAPRIFLEEIDKVKLSEFAINQIFRLLDAVDRHQAQLVMDSNLSRRQFLDLFGEPIYRRIKENCQVKEYGF